MKQVKKSYFSRRTEVEIKDLPNLTRTDHQKDLIERIRDLDPNTDALIIDLSNDLIVPQRFFRRGMTLVDASRLAYKHASNGHLIPLSQPRTLQKTLDCNEIQLQMREIAFARLRHIKQQNNRFMGYSFWPVFGTNQEKRVVRFRELSEGAKLFTYSENFSWYDDKDGNPRNGIKTQIYGDSERAIKEGAWAVVQVPSRTKKQGKYQFALFHVPFMPNPPSERRNYNLATSFSIERGTVVLFEVDAPQKATNTWEDYHARFPFKDAREGSDEIFLNYLDVAGYLAIIKESLTQQHNQTPLQFNPYALPSRLQPGFYYKLENNVLVHDPTLESKYKLRHLHLAETSVLLSRGIGFFGHDDFSFWNPVRDGVYKDYVWNAG